MTRLLTTTATACALIALLSVLGPIAACGGNARDGKPASADKGGGKKGPQAFPVEVAVVQSRDVQLVIPAVGSLDAFERVQVTARVSGVVEKIKFTEGDLVKNGQVLVEIEPRRYQVAVRSAKAALERVKASGAEAAAGLQRRQLAIDKSPGLIPAEELETWRTRQSLANAEEAEAAARLEEANLNLRDAYVRAPTTGTIETRNVQTGQFMQPGVVLATLVQRDPLLLRFQVAEADAGMLKNGMTVGFKVQGDDTEYRATITHVAALADMSTRMVPVTGEVAPEQRDRLRPGSFAEVKASVGTNTNSPIVPEIAVRPSERGFLAFVIEEDSSGKPVARERIVKLGMHTEDGHVEVREGLKAGERLVIRGGEALKDGAAVRVSGAASTGPREKPDQERTEVIPP
jgi:multidrug efflux system membrane fusion protein